MSGLLAGLIALMIGGGFIATVVDNWREAHPVYPKREVSPRRWRRMHVVDRDLLDDWKV
jgi:hypothetical protein